jgi:hypothetical protein
VFCMLLQIAYYVMYELKGMRDVSDSGSIFIKVPYDTYSRSFSTIQFLVGNKALFRAQRKCAGAARILNIFCQF